MELTKAHLIYFSPTSTSKQVAESIVHGTGIENIEVTDVTHTMPGETIIEQNVLTIIAVPVYGGMVAQLALERIKNIKGKDTPVVLVVVYGNRAYEKSLMQLDAFAMRQRFSVIAAATFVGEHSYSNSEYPVAKGRPDDNDLEIASGFGKSIIEKISKFEQINKIYPVDVRAIKRPKQPFIPLLRFMKDAIKLRKSGIPMPKIPATDAALCIHCSICVELCPNGAINEGDELHTNPEKCIRCCACVKGCPQSARLWQSPFAVLLSKHFSKQKQPQILI